jgi:ABC-2 type transport system ATP-binding protein
VRSLAADGATVFVSSHLLAEVEQICTHAAIMRAGRLVAQGTLAELRQAGQARIRVLTPDAGAAVQVLAGLGLTVNADGGTRGGAPVGPGEGAGGAGNGSTPEGAVLFAPLPVTGSHDAVQPEAVVAALVAAGVRVRGFGTEQASLEERFVALTGEGFDVVQ